MSEYQEEVYQAREVPGDGGTTLVVGDLVLNSTNDHAGGSSGSTTSFDLDLTNVLGTDEDFLITLNSSDQPASWTAGFSVDGTVIPPQALISRDQVYLTTGPARRLLAPGMSGIVPPAFNRRGDALASPIVRPGGSLLRVRPRNDTNGEDVIAGLRRPWSAWRAAPAWSTLTAH